jgi:hypothetical protein
MLLRHECNSLVERAKSAEKVEVQYHEDSFQKFLRRKRGGLEKEARTTSPPSSGRSSQQEGSLE